MLYVTFSFFLLIVLLPAYPLSCVGSKYFQIHAVGGRGVSGKSFPSQYAYRAPGGANLALRSLQPDTGLHCQTTDTRLVHRAVCLFTPPAFAGFPDNRDPSFVWRID